MKTINFYRQARMDGGKRTGIEIDEETVMEQFEEGTGMEDSALLWFVDIRCSGAPLPNDPASARAWLMEKAPVIQEGISMVANELQAGIDSSTPVSRPIPNMGAGITVKIVCSAIRRLPALKIAEACRGIE
jgi:hypothetical protein